MSRSVTSRPRRSSDAADAYYFVSRERFEEMIAESAFLEWAQYEGNLYGTPIPGVMDDPDEGAQQRVKPSDLVLEIELEGAKQIKDSTPESVLIFVLPPTLEVLETRLRARDQDISEEVIRGRLARAIEELQEGTELADHIVINDDLDVALDAVSAIIDSYAA